MEGSGIFNGTGQAPETLEDNVTIDVKFWIKGVINLIVGVFGSLGNLLAIAVLLSPKMELVPSIRKLLIVLATFDTLYLSSYLVVTCPGNWSAYYRDNYE